MQLFPGWRIVATSFFAQAVAAGLTAYSLGIFFPSLASEFGLSRFGIGLGFTLLGGVGALVSPLLGRKVDGGSIRGLMVLGALLLGAGFALLALVTALWQVAVIFVSAVGMGAAMIGHLPNNALLARWFRRQRGRVLGIAAVGVSLAGFVVPPLVTLVIDGFGWRSALWGYAFLASAVLAPTLWFSIVDRPEDLGLAPDGDPPGGAAASAEAQVASEDEGAGFYLRDPSFWAITVCIGLGLGTATLFLTHLVPFATDIGIDSLQAAFIMSLYACAAIGGKLAFGVVSDRIGERPALRLAIGVLGLGWLALLQQPGYSRLLAAGVGIGIGIGAMQPLWGALVARAYGAQAVGRSMGLMTLVMYPFVFVPPPLAGWIADTTGSYALAFQGSLVAVGAALVATLLLRLSEPDAQGVAEVTGGRPSELG